MINGNSILLRRKNKIIVACGDACLPPSSIATINKNLESLGYTLSESVLDALATLRLDEGAGLFRGNRRQ
jgi:hypothetical protein